MPTTTCSERLSGRTCTLLNSVSHVGDVLPAGSGCHCDVCLPVCVPDSLFQKVMSVSPSVRRC